MDEVIQYIKSLYPQVDIYVTENDYKIHLMSIEVPPEDRSKGIGTNILNILKDYSVKVGKPIVLTPEAERGKKAKLDKFYRSSGFVHNKGRNRDFRLSNTFGPTMYWRPGFKEWFLL